MWLDIETACRGCPECLNARAYKWKRRAAIEWAQAPRTWLVTLTFDPQLHVEFEARARAAAAASGFEWSKLTAAERFARTVSVSGAELTRFVKRLRKNTGSKLRYLLVAEQHKSGKPHFHMLLHEVAGSNSIQWKAIDFAWRGGFMTAKLVRDIKGAGYAAKYLAKAKGAKVRASLGYGDGPPRSKVQIGRLPTLADLELGPPSSADLNVKTMPPNPPMEPPYQRGDVWWENTVLPTLQNNPMGLTNATHSESDPAVTLAADSAADDIPWP